MNENNINGRVCWITGSGRGIGRAIAIALAEKGARVVLSARTESELNETAQDIETSQGKVIAIPCDVFKRADVIRLVKSVNEKWGHIHTLVNNAGTGIFKKIENLSEKEWDEMMDVNLKSAFLCTQAVLPPMLENKAGHIINIVSVAGKTPFLNCGGYCASKYGLLGFTEVLRMEVRQKGVQVTSFLPGATDTAIWGDANVDRKKMMTPEQVASGILSICNNSDTMIEEVVMRPMGGDL